MTQKAIEMLRHTIGADSKQPGYRNRYCTGVKDPVALELVSLGLFVGPQYTAGEVGKEHGLFFATEKAFQLLGIKELT